MGLLIAYFFYSSSHEIPLPSFRHKLEQRGSVGKAINHFLSMQAGRGFLWLVLLYALGIAFYFLLPVEPSRSGLLALSAALGLFTAAHKKLRLLWALVLVPVIGATWACWYTSLQEPVMLRYEISPRPISGVVQEIERVEKGVRFTLAQVAIRSVAADKTPHRVRLSLRLKPENNLALPRIGDRVSLLAGLLPPMGAAMPGGFDFARYFYFRDIGAVGYGLPPWKVEQAAAASGLRARFEQWRLMLTERIIAKLGPQNGPIAAGLITGEDRAIREADFEALKAANLYHIIAISGGHMVVIAGVIFVSLRLLLLLVPGLGQRARTKAAAAGLTLGMVTLYLFVTGLPISAVRAYVMIALVLLAVLLRREVDALRSLLLAAFIMLVLDPSDLLEPGFQLSFVATLAIVALVELRWLRPPLHDEPSLLAGAWRIMAAAILIALVAEGATSLLVARMFNTLAPYGVLANALATPLVGIVIMPTVALYFLLLPLGLETFALRLMDYGIDALLWIARSIASLPNAQLFLPSPPSWGMVLFVGGLLGLCMLRGRVRWAGAACMAMGWASILSVTLPQLLIGTDAKHIALRTPDGYALVRGRADSLVPKLWANALGYKALPVLKPGTSPWRCDRMGCVATIQNTQFAFPYDAVALMEDCQRADWVVSILRTRGCDARVITEYSLARHGVHVYDGQNWHTSAQWQGDRPWSMGW